MAAGKGKGHCQPKVLEPRMPWCMTGKGVLAMETLVLDRIEWRVENAFVDASKKW